MNFASLCFERSCKIQDLTLILCDPYPLAGAILWRKNDEEPIKVMVREGKTTNVLWVRIGSKRYAFSYNHDEGQIEMREGGIQGPTLHTFTNDTPLSSVRAIFEAL